MNKSPRDMTAQEITAEAMRRYREGSLPEPRPYTLEERAAMNEALRKMRRDPLTIEARAKAERKYRRYNP